jgi:hypothetical protein
MAETAGAANHWGVKGRRLVSTAGAVLVVALTAAGATATGGSQAAPGSFKLVFEGRHNAALLHEGTFTSSVVDCPSGSAADVSFDTETESALRKFTCVGTKGEFTARVAPLPAEHGGLGSWQIVAGSGPLADLRGKGTWTSTRLAGRPDDPATIVFRSAWDGVADFDVTAPTIGVSSASARKLRRPKGTYKLRAVLSLSDAEGGVVSYRLEIVDPRKPLNLLGWKKGETTATSVATVRVHPAKTTRVLQLNIAANDAVGNDATFTKTVRLR